ncbi:hypothetical protein DSD19_06155 [Rhodovulum sp. BSW8]|uniref:hypothetical protein n=1 Tax=Rhodovulum sp. BSW8 TaxID=2259645 RepID=UPI000DE202DA|nr:hypothetical protein [Rhodovulum sp. BSW8]RBO54043.1 hypothetical protein DSD19_06155 [Rhodovulum sp. BSW8]
MKLRTINHIRTVRFPEGIEGTPIKAIQEEDVEGLDDWPIWPSRLFAQIGIEVMDDITPEGCSPRDVDFEVVIRCDPTESLATIEQRSLRQLASDLAVLSEEIARAAEEG